MRENLYNYSDKGKNSPLHLCSISAIVSSPCDNLGQIPFSLFNRLEDRGKKVGWPAQPALLIGSGENQIQSPPGSCFYASPCPASIRACRLKPHINQGWLTLLEAQDLG